MIENKEVYIMYTADGIQREWEFPYQFAEEDDIALYVEHQGELTQIPAHLFTFDKDTKKVTYPKDDVAEPVAQGDTVLLWRQTAITQLEDSSVQNFKSNDVERSIDKLTMICQELSDRLGRVIGYSPTDYYGKELDASKAFDELKEYTDDQIAAHNTNNAAHSDIREAIATHEANTSNPHQVTKEQVGLGRADNTADFEKPVSEPVQAALNLKQDNLTSAQQAAVNSGINSTLVDQIGMNSAAIASEIADRQDADTLLQNQINNLDSSKQNTLTQAQLDAVNSGITSDKVAFFTGFDNEIADINAKIPSEATSANQLADKSYVNDAVNSSAAYYVTASPTGDSFASKAALVAGPWYFDGSLRTPTMNDYAIVAEDETHDNRQARYVFTGTQWSFQWPFNDTQFTQSQLNAMDSGITEAKVDAYDTHVINTSNPHEVTKEQVGLGNVDNTSDLNKPVSVATQNALNALSASKASKADETTILDNGATISTVAVKEQNANVAVKEWVGTKAQYEAIATKDPSTTYIVTDEDDSAFLSVDSTLSSASENPVQNKVIKAALDRKQNIISDLSEIRSGAAAGATALQPATAASTYIPQTQKGVANGVAPLNANAQVPEANLPDNLAYQTIIRDWED